MVETTNDVVESIDVREIPKAKRHPKIHDVFGDLSEGEILEIIASHEPEHLRQEFVQRYGNGFSWEVKEKGQNKWRIWIVDKEPIETPF